MGDMGELKKPTIKQIFETMEYGKDAENLNEVLDWFKSKDNKIYVGDQANGDPCTLKNFTNEEKLCDIYSPDSGTVELVLKKLSGSKNKLSDLPSKERAELLYKLSQEIKKHEGFFLKVECVARGILAKDTKTKGLPLLTEFLRYYSSFAINRSIKDSNEKGIAVAIISDYNSLWTLGAFLGPALAAGYRVILQTSFQLTPTATYLTELATKIGIPDGTITVIPGTTDPNTFFTNTGVTLISIFDDIYKDEFMIANHFNKKLLHFHSAGSPVLVFENSDLDSACHSVIDAAWGYKGMLPWSVRNVFVQENIFEVFVKKLKSQLKKIRVDKAHLKNTDISFPDDFIMTKLRKINKQSKDEGVELYEPKIDCMMPYLLIGGNNFPNNVIKEDLLNIPIVSVTAFRTSNEAVNLANNSRHGFGISLWTENTSLVNELIGKLKFGNVWVNSHGLFSANITNSPYKTDGNGVFGGKEGFYEYNPHKNVTNETAVNPGDATIMEKAISEAKKAQESWCKLPISQRQQILQELAYSIGDKTEWSDLIHKHLELDRGNSFISCKNYNVITSREPCGVIAVEFSQEKNVRLIVAALMEGNSVIVLTDRKDLTFLCGSPLPKNLVTIIPNSQDAIKVAALHKELNVYVGESPNKMFASLPLKTSSKFRICDGYDWNQVRNKVSLFKNVWFNKGQSFI